jgi:adenylyltransferase and sulfurtransferase
MQASAGAGGGAGVAAAKADDGEEGGVSCVLSPPDLVSRYSRQMLVPSFGPHAQASLASLCVLVVGAGGLGCPVALYLAGAGVGRLVLVDDDTVTPSNLHRQVAFTEEDARAGRSKADALARSCTALNGLVRCEAVVGRFGPGTAAGLVDRADVIVDATDNPGTRYLLNDAAVLAGKPVVSGAALGADGQVSVYGWAASGGGDGEGGGAARVGVGGGGAGGGGGGGGWGAAPGPCYRCLFPTPPPATATGSCADSGVLGPITGIIGCLQALEVLKIAADLARTRLSSGAGRTSTTPATGSGPTLGLPLAGTLLLLDGAESRFRSVRMRGRSPACAVCGDAPTIRSVEESARWLAENGVASVEGGPACAPAASVAADTVPYVNARAFREAVEGQCRGRSGEEAVAVPTSPPSPLLLDVREPLQFEMAHLRGTRNIPLADMRAAVEGCAGDEGAAKEALLALVAARCGAGELGGGRAVHVICRRGVDSVDAARLLRRVAGLDAYDVRGGLQAYADMQRRDGVEEGRRFPHY